MNKNIEIEYKILINKKQYEQMKLLFKNKPYQQINYYFDTKDEFLRKQRITLRTRFKDNKYEFTLKRFGDIGLDEYNENITKEDFINLTKQIPIKSQILELLKKDYDLDLTDLCQIYTLKTTRIDKPYMNGVLSLDLSEYMNVIDYELEYEVISTENAVENFNAFLKPFHLQYTTNCKGKRHRLCDALYGHAKS